MAFIPLPFAIKVEVSWTTGSGVAVCIHYVSKTTPAAVVAGDLTNAITHFDTWRLALRPVMAASAAIAGIRATDWGVADGLTQFTVPSATPNGSNVSNPAPLNVAICASHYSGLSGRSRRGRNYIPAVGENTINVGDIITTLNVTQIINAYQALRTNLLTSGLVQVVASFHTNGAPRVTGLGTAVSFTAVDQYSDSQRRRLAGRGA